MNVPSLSKVESVLLIAGVGLGGYFVWKAYVQAKGMADATVQGVGDAIDSVRNAYNTVGETVRASVNDAREGVTSFTDSPGAMFGVSSSQLALWKQQAGDAGNFVGRALQGAGEAELASQNGGADTFTEAASRMAKPTYGELNTPTSEYQ